MSPTFVTTVQGNTHTSVWRGEVDRMYPDKMCVCPFKRVVHTLNIPVGVKLKRQHQNNVYNRVFEHGVTLPISSKPF